MFSIILGVTNRLVISVQNIEKSEEDSISGRCTGRLKVPIITVFIEIGSLTTKFDRQAEA